MIVWLLIVLILGMHGWFAPGVLSAGDWGYRFPEMVRAAMPWTSSWSTFFGGGLGGTKLILAPLDTWMLFWTQLTQRAGIPWQIAERLFWFLPPLLIAAYGGTVLSRRMSRGVFTSVGGIFAANTYLLLIVSGGQMGVLWSIALVPLVLDRYIAFLDRSTEQERIDPHSIASLIIVSSVQILFDVRFFYTTGIAIILYWMWLCITRVMRLRGTIVVGISMALTALGVFALHAFWMLPVLLYRTSPADTLGAAYISSDALKFFSFADFSHALTLLHPNWPENMFGKTYFLQPEFLVLPMLAMASLLFINKEKRAQKSVLSYFVLLGILAAFLSKGVQEPFGIIYRLLFQYIPGFIMFRDPTKFYVLTAISYAVLIPYTLQKIAEGLNTHPKSGPNRWIFFVLLCFTGIWFVLHRDFVRGDIQGTFLPSPVPHEYSALKDRMIQDTDYSRILWIPDRSRYGYYADNHPAISLETVGVSSVSAFPAWIRDPIHREQLARYGVGYIVVPSDPKGELFVTDRHYDGKLRERTITDVAASLLDKRQQDIEGLAVFALDRHYAHTFETDSHAPIPIREERATRYVVTLHQGVRSMTFSERFDPYWILEISGHSIMPKKTTDGLQEYILPESVSGTGVLWYRPEQTANIGFVISGIVGVVVCLVWIATKKKQPPHMEPALNKKRS